MPRYVMEIECSVRILNEDRVEVGSARIEGSVAIASNSRGVHSIIDSTTQEFAEDLSTHAKRIFERPAVPQ